MRHKKRSDKIIITFFSIALFIIIIFGSLNFMIFNKDFYFQEYSKNNVYESIPEGLDAELITDNMFRYFRGNAELEYFDDAEKDHMRDVKILIRIMQFSYYGAALACIIFFIYSYRKYKDEKYLFLRIISRSTLYSAIASIIFLTIIFLLAVFSFDLLFTVFHLILFPQGNWIFDSSSLLITLFPIQFFFDISLRIFVYAMFQSLIFFSIGYWLRRQLKNVERYLEK